MRIVLAGSSGFVGKALKARLVAERHELCCLRRLAGSGGGGVVWDPQKGRLDFSELEHADAVVNLCGAGLAEQRWSQKRMLELHDSRIAPTRTLVSAMALCSHPPKTFISVSAIGYYGGRGDTVVTEGDRKGTGFLADLCAEWESCARQAEGAGVRVISLRVGMVIGPEGGVVGRLRPIYRLGLGGPIGLGFRWMSWISREDLVRAVLFLIKQPKLSGPVNAVAPNPVRGWSFSRCLARTFRRPALIPVPPLMLRLIYGAMAEETILASTRVAPTKLVQAGFEYQHPSLDQAMRGIS